MYRQFALTTFLLGVCFMISSVAHGESLPCDDANNCCPLAACEDPKGDLVTGRKWDVPGSPESITFDINPGSDPTLPSLVNDATIAASQWTDILFQGRTVKVRIFFGDIENDPGKWPGRQDFFNIVGWSSSVFNTPAET